MLIYAYSSSQTCLTTTVTAGIAQCYLMSPAEVKFPPVYLDQLTLVLDLATPEGCRAELTSRVTDYIGRWRGGVVTTQQVAPRVRLLVGLTR